MKPIHSRETARDSRETARDSRETRETACARPAKQARDTAKQARDSCETYVNPCNELVRLRSSLSPCPPSVPTRPLAPYRRYRWLVSTSDALAPRSRLRGDTPLPPPPPPSASKSPLHCHAASRRKVAACYPSPISPARTRACLALPRTAAQATAQGRCIGEAAMWMRLPSRHSRPLCAVTLAA